MAAVYSTQLIGLTVSDGVVAVFDVEEGFVVVVRDITALLLSDYTSGGALSMAADGLTFAGALWPFSFQDTWHWQGRCVVPGPSTITATVIGNDALAEVVCSGYVLTLP